MKVHPLVAPFVVSIALVSTFVAASAFVLTGCSSSSQEVRETTPAPKERAAEASADPAQRIAELAKAENPSRTEIASRVVSRDDMGMIVEISWNERAPNTVEALDDAPMHVVRRFLVRGDEIEAVAPKAWEVNEPLVVCADGRSDLLLGLNEDKSCVSVPKSGHIEPTGDSILVPDEGPIPAALAYRVRLPGDSKVYWTIPAHACVNDIELDDGTTGRAIGSCSSVGIEGDEPELFRD